LSECGDDDRDLFPQRSVCWPTAQLKAAEELYMRLHEDAPYHDGTFERWAEKRSIDFPFHAMDGVAFWLSPVDLSPDDDFLGNRPGHSELSDRPDSSE
jgi:hypothetical protein